MIGIDVPISRLVQIFTNHLWTGLGVDYFGRVYRNERDGGVIPEVFDWDKQDYIEVLQNDNKVGTVFFDWVNPSEINSSSNSATVWIHFAVNCASIGCPNLQPVPFTSENADEMLSKAAKEYINHRRGVSISGNKLIISGIFDWYYTDFAKTKKGVIEFLIQYADKDLAEKLKNYKGSISYDYDWSLNEI